MSTAILSITHVYKFEHHSIICHMSNRLFEMMEAKRKTVQQVADGSGFTIDYIYRIRNPKYKERLNEDNIKLFSDAIGCYPSELLPLEWQKPNTQEIDVNILKEVIQQITEENNLGQESATPEQLYALMALWYKQKMKEKNGTKGTSHALDNKKLTT